MGAPPEQPPVVKFSLSGQWPIPTAAQGRYECKLPLERTMQGERFYVVRRNKLILSANGRHATLIMPAQERNPKQYHFRLRAWQRAVPTLSSCGRILSPANDVNAGFQCWPGLAGRMISLSHVGRRPDRRLRSMRWGRAPRWHIGEGRLDWPYRPSRGGRCGWRDSALA
jgi:hypothetical protein